MLRKLLIAGVSWLALGVAVIPDSSFAARGGFGGGAHFGGGGMHFGGGGMHFGGGGMHFGGGGMHFGGVHSFGGMRSFGGAHSFGAFRGHSFAARHFAPRHFGGHFGHAAHFARAAHFGHHAVSHRQLSHNRLAQNRALHNERVNRQSVAALHNNTNRFQNRTELANRGREGFGNFRRTGNAFTNAKFGGHEWGHHGHFRRFWAGGVFWPFFWGDYFSYAFWPYDYYDDFWGWGPDVLLWSAFWPDYYYPYWDYGYYGAGYYGGGTSYGDIYGRYRSYAAAPQPERLATVGREEASATCAGFAPGVNTLPAEQIAKIVELAPDQRQAFDDLKAAMARASEVLAQACPAQTLATPVARLDAMDVRLTAMLQAEQIIRGPLETFYRVLSPEQKQRLDAAVAAGQPKERKQVDLAKLCSSQAGFTNVPEKDIESTISLDARQRRDLDALNQASAKAAQMLRDTCPANVPNTLEGRLDAANARLRALIQAINTVRPEVRTFFASLSPAQRSALNSEAPRTRTAAARR
jgi:LTXXQ motif family protein